MLRGRSCRRDERKPEPHRSSGDPAVGGVLLLGERVAGGYKIGAQLCIDGDELGAAVDDLDPLDLGRQPEHARAGCQPRRIASYRSSGAVWKEMNASRPVMSGAWCSASREPGTRSALKTSVSMTIGPRDRTVLRTRRPPGRRRLPSRCDRRSPSHRVEVAVERGAVAPRLAARDVLHGCLMRASTLFRYRPLPGGKSMIYVPGSSQTGVGPLFTNRDRAWPRVRPRARRPARPKSPLRPQSAGVLKLVDHVAVAGQCQACVVTELAHHVDDVRSLVEQ